MPHEASPAAVVIFALFAAGTLGLSRWLGKRARGAAGYFAAHGRIPWFVNGVALAGDFLGAASFLGVCGMIAFYGYDGFLYGIGLFAGWVVALFVIAEPMQRLGKFTFADALNVKFNSGGVKVAAGLSTLTVSVFLLIPQTVAAGTLATPLLGLPHWAGVTLVGGVVIAIVTTAGMVSTTWTQFVAGGLLIAFGTILVGCVLWRGFEPVPLGDVPTIVRTDAPTLAERLRQGLPPGWEPAGPSEGWSPGAIQSPFDGDTYFAARRKESDEVRVYAVNESAMDSGDQLSWRSSLTTFPDGTV